jgi:DNA-binding cell septation regulator SpoVG
MPEKAKPAGASGGHREIQISDWKAFQKNTLQGFLSLTLPSGLVIHNCTLHQKDGSRWIGLPARQYAKDDGTTSYTPLVEFSTKDARQRFQTAALEALDRYTGGRAR